jgi:hypothetical protein
MSIACVNAVVAHIATQEQLRGHMFTWVLCYLSSGIAWDESCPPGISIAKGNLYEVCRLGAKGLLSKSKQKETKGQAAISCTDRKQTDGMEQWAKQQSAAQTGSLLAPAAELRLTLSVVHAMPPPSPIACSLIVQVYVRLTQLTVTTTSHRSLHYAFPIPFTCPQHFF